MAARVDWTYYDADDLGIGPRLSKRRAEEEAAAARRSYTNYRKRRERRRRRERRPVTAWNADISSTDDEISSFDEGEIFLEPALVVPEYHTIRHRRAHPDDPPLGAAPSEVDSVRWIFFFFFFFFFFFLCYALFRRLCPASDRRNKFTFLFLPF